MKLSPAQIVSIRNILRYSPATDVDGKPILRSFVSVEDKSAVRWFIKNTEKVIKDYTAKLNEKKKELEEAKKDELAEERLAFKNLRKYISEAKDEEKVFMEAVVKILQTKAVSRDIEKELSEYITPFFNEEYDIDVNEKAQGLLKRVYTEAEIGSDDIVGLELCEKFGVI